MNVSRIHQQGYFKLSGIQFLFFSCKTLFPAPFAWYSKEISILRFILLVFFLTANYQVLWGQNKTPSFYGPDILWEENEFPGGGYTKGSFVATDDDFILTAGQYFKGSPPSSQDSFIYKKETITNTGQWNNDTIELLQNLGSSEEVLSRLEAGIQHDPHFFPLHYNKARILAAKDQYKAALEEFKQAANEIPEYSRTWIHMAELYFLLGKETEAEFCLKKAILINPLDTEALLLLAEKSLHFGLKDRAKLYLNEALKRDSDGPNTILIQAFIATYNRKEEIALSLFRKTTIFFNSGKRKKYNRKFHYIYAEIAFQLMDYKTAASEYTRLLEFPYDPLFMKIPISYIKRKQKEADTMSQKKK